MRTGLDFAAPYLAAHQCVYHSAEQAPYAQVEVAVDKVAHRAPAIAHEQAEAVACLQQ